MNSDFTIMLFMFKLFVISRKLKLSWLKTLLSFVSLVTGSSQLLWLQMRHPTDSISHQVLENTRFSFVIFRSWNLAGIWTLLMSCLQVPRQNEEYDIDGLMQERHNSLLIHWSYMFLALSHQYVSLMWCIRIMNLGPGLFVIKSPHKIYY